jgi:hypothetical protein
VILPGTTKPGQYRYKRVPKSWPNFFSFFNCLRNRLLKTDQTGTHSCLFCPDSGSLIMLCLSLKSRWWSWTSAPNGVNVHCECQFVQKLFYHWNEWGGRGYLGKILQNKWLASSLVDGTDCIYTNYDYNMRRWNNGLFFTTWKKIPCWDLNRGRPWD